MARLSYLAEILMNRRVLLIGNDFELARFVSESRARHVIAVDEQPSAMPWPERSSTPGIEFQVMDLASLRFRDGSFDIAVLPDLTALNDPTAMLGEIRRIIGPQGQTMIGAPNPTCELRLGQQSGRNGIDYYEMYDLLAEVFPHVQMIGQSPFVGYTVADLSAADEELDIRFDGSLLGDETEDIEWFLAVCGEHPVELSAYSIIQIPFGDVAMGQVSQGDPDRVIQLESETEQLKNSLQDAKLELSTRGVRIESLEKDLENELLQSEAARARAVQVSKELDEDRKASQRKTIEEQYSKRSQDMDLQANVKDLSIQLRQAEERAIAAEASRDDIVDRMREDAAELDRLRNRLAAMEEETQRPSAEEASLKSEIQDLQTKLNLLSIQLKQAEERASTAEASRDNIVDRMRADGAELDQLRNKIDAIEEKSQKSSAEKQALATEVQDLQSALKEAREKASAAVAEEADTSALEEESERNAEILAAEISDLERRLEEKAASLKNAEAEIERHEAISRDLIVALERQGTPESLPEGDQEPLRGELHRTSEELAKARSEVHEKEETLQEITSDLATANTRLESAEGTIAELKQTLEDAQKKPGMGAGEPSGPAGDANLTEEQNQKIAELEGTLQSARWRADEMEARNQDMQRLVEEKDFKLRSLQEEVESLNKKTDAKESEKPRQGELEAGERSARMFEEEAKQQTERATYLQQSLDQSRARINELEQQLQQAAENQTRFESELGNLSKRSEEAERLAKEAGDRGGKTIEQLEEATARLQSVSVELDGSHAQIVSLQTAVEEAETAVRQEMAEELEEANQLSAQVSELEERLKEMDYTLSKERSRSEDLLSTMETLRTEKETAAEEDAAEIAGETDALHAQLVEKEQEIKQADEALETNQDVLAKLRQEMSGIWTKNEQIQTAWNAEKERAATLQTEIDRIKTEQGAAQDLESEFENVRTRADRLEEELGSSQHRVTELENELKKTKTRTGNLEAGLEEARRQADLLKNELGDTSQVTTDIELERDKVKERANAFKAELDEALQRVQALESDAENRSQHATQHENQLAQITEEKLTISKKLEDSEDLRARLESTLEESKNLIEGVRLELGQTTTRIAELEADAQASTANTEMVAQLQDQLQQTQTELQEALARPEESTANSEVVIELRTELEKTQMELQSSMIQAAEVTANTEVVAELQDQLQQTQAELQEAQLQATQSVAPGDDVVGLRAMAKEQEKLLESLTTQLEEREQRANRLERQVRELGIQIKEHESDIVAWEMELKFRNTRISQLETENENLQQDLAATPQKPGPPPPPLPQGVDGPVGVPGSSPDDNPDALRAKVGQLNEALGDKDAELLILHGQIEDSQRRMEYTRNILEDIVRQNKVDPQTAQQFSDLVQSMK